MVGVLLDDGRRQTGDPAVDKETAYHGAVDGNPPSVGAIAEEGRAGGVR